MNAVVASAACLLAVSLSAVTPAAAYGTGEWIQGRATFFGRDAWSLHEGSCGFGFVCPNRWGNELASGYDLTAISDQNPLFQGHRGSQCGQCLEVACRSAVISDRYGEKFDRQGLCKDESTSVKVKITDTCDCSYGPNSASNARWCCGDQPHLDVSQWALDKLVSDSNRWGVFAIQYRTIDCEATLSNPAPAIPLVADPHVGQKPADLDCASQGAAASDRALNTEAARVQRATSISSAVEDKGGYHSRKFWNRRKNLVKARGQIHTKAWYQKVQMYYDQFNASMKRIANNGIKFPFWTGSPSG